LKGKDLRPFAVVRVINRGRPDTKGQQKVQEAGGPQIENRVRRPVAVIILQLIDEKQAEPFSQSFTEMNISSQKKIV
jgi:hypothetical protein